ncbi:hypothetical protein M011DRAFT_488301 [Sporormia fimetaria CBS 119925]|uniref:Uncharacterized protein n=1 Tax=Sporormia fimetaria CBS 119925 TaxID=1340428 RepID=A0A6A6V5R1_9PLEO|nr:hypothetical protein M011DRAFT_488301 [Sporormia fimetaria CBS 119925]
MHCIHVKTRGSWANLKDSRWMAQLSPSKQKNLFQIMRNDWLVTALSDLEPFRALWKTFYLGSVPYILSLRYFEEVA